MSALPVLQALNRDELRQVVIRIKATGSDRLGSASLFLSDNLLQHVQAENLQDYLSSGFHPLPTALTHRRSDRVGKH
jgi:hypothetical protein